VPGRLAVIANPSSQNGALGKRWPDLVKRLGRILGDFDAQLTTAPGDATRLARRALDDGADVVVAVGGDGTTHEVVNGFFDEAGKPRRPGAALGLLPFGTGGDFRRSLGLGTDLDLAAQVIAAGKRRTIDVGRIEYRQGGVSGPPAASMFINIAGFGVGGLIDKIVNQSSKALGGKLTFAIGTLRAAVRHKNPRVRMVFDDDEDAFVEAVINNVAVANGQYFGGGMHIAPHAELDDGVFDVVTLGDMSTWDYLKDGLSVYKGQHLALAKVSSRRARSVLARPVASGEEVLLDVDGEQLGALPARFTLVPRSLDLLVP
jgi:YegS/Rv2252/BmrU family lipid kinase